MRGTNSAAVALCCLVAAVIATFTSPAWAADSGTSTAPSVEQVPNRYERPEPPGAHPNARIETLVVRDVAEGDGAVLEGGDTAHVDFIGADYITGRPIDSAWGEPRLFSAPIESGAILGGWWQGLQGMRVGGRRVLIIPPVLGFQNNPSINPALANTALYYVIDLLGVSKAQPAGAPPPSVATVPLTSLPPVFY